MVGFMLLRTGKRSLKVKGDVKVESGPILVC
jgi:hypothetical protein